MGTFACSASFLQDSNSGAAWRTLPSSLPTFTVTAAVGGLDRHELAAELAPLGGITADAERAGLAHQHL